MPDFNNGYSCDVRFESIAKKLEPDLESPCGLLDKNDDVVVEDYEVDEDGQIFEEDDECDGEGVINDQIEEISDGEIEQFDVDNDDNNNYNNENEEDNNDGGDKIPERLQYNVASYRRVIPKPPLEIKAGNRGLKFSVVKENRDAGIISLGLRMRTFMTGYKQSCEVIERGK
ncbi:7853_t:CDS:2 [Entrophospora sp. SA101]|nr:7853_t:CDS:2 [Entrophospora sp. SA101]